MNITCTQKDRVLRIWNQLSKNHSSCSYRYFLASTQNFGIKVHWCDARSRQIEWVQENLFHYKQETKSAWQWRSYVIKERELILLHSDKLKRNKFMTIWWATYHPNMLPYYVYLQYGTFKCHRAIFFTVRAI